MVQFIPLIILTGVFPVPSIVALIMFFKKKKREKLIFNKELKKFLWVNYSLEGRVKREDYWYYGWGLFWTMYAIIFLFGGIFAAIFYYTIGKYYASNTIVQIIGGIYMALGGTLIYVSYGMKFLSNKIKRLHDNNKSGWFLLWTLVPILGQLFGLYIFITNWFLRGTISTNDFGADPVEKDIMPVITIKDVAKTFGLLLIIITIFAVYAVVVGLLTGGI